MTMANVTRLHVAPPSLQFSAPEDAWAPRFATLEGARDALRSGVGWNTLREVHVHGSHFLERTFTLDDRDTATAECPIRYVGRAGARLSGGKRISPDAFHPIQVPSGASGVYVADLFAMGLNVSVLGSLTNPYPKAKLELFYDGAPMTLARDPNIGTDPLATWQWAGYETFHASDNMSFTLNDSAIGHRWQSALRGSSSLWIHGYFKFDWRDTYVQLVDISVDGSGVYKMTRSASTPPQYPWTNEHPRLYALDALELLDAPGEYYVDPQKGTLYFLPPGGAISGEAVVSPSPLISAHQHRTLWSRTSSCTIARSVCSTL